MQRYLTLFLIISLTSCIPVKVAPKFKNEDYKIVYAKKFQKKLSKEMAFIFKDPKDEGEIYNYFNKKYQSNGNDVGLNVPFKLKNYTLYISYQEVERIDKTINLPLALIDAKRESNGNSRLFEGNYSSRKGHWYIILTVYDDTMKNCLKDKHPLKNEVTKYLDNLRAEYISTYNYEELLLEKKS